MEMFVAENGDGTLLRKAGPNAIRAFVTFTPD
jgi:hypothetical protein